MNLFTMQRRAASCRRCQVWAGERTCAPSSRLAQQHDKRSAVSAAEPPRRPPGTVARGPTVRESDTATWAAGRALWVATGLAVLYALLFDFSIMPADGLIRRSLELPAPRTSVSVAPPVALAKLRAAGLLNWVRRCVARSARLDVWCQAAHQRLCHTADQPVARTIDPAGSAAPRTPTWGSPSPTLDHWMAAARTSCGASRRA